MGRRLDSGNRDWLATSGAGVVRASSDDRAGGVEVNGSAFSRLAVTAQRNAARVDADPIEFSFGA
jgi:hypothetical protein